MGTSGRSHPTDGATIVSATLRLRRGTVSGTSPFTTHGTCWADVQSGGLSGSTTLETGDLQATATALHAERRPHPP